MVVRASRYYDTTIKWYRGVMQGDPLFRKIFNIILDSVVRNSLIIVEGEAAVLEVFDLAVNQMASLLCADGGLLVPTQLEWIQW